MGDKIANCTFVSGHINIIRMDKRRKEADLGRVVTTTRGVVDTYLSKYYHRTWTNFSEEVYHKSVDRRNLLWYFRGVDPCEVLRYYDGIPGCNLEHRSLLRRVKSIVALIDCAVDTDNAQEDVGRLCEVMGLENCMPFGRQNSKQKKGAVDRYARVKKDELITEEIQRALGPAMLLRQRLLMKRCSKLKDEDSERWPNPKCQSMQVNVK